MSDVDVINKTRREMLTSVMEEHNWTSSTHWNVSI